MKILKGIQKVPGGIMVIPLLLGAIVNTFFPSILKIGGFTTAMFSNAGFPAITGVTFFCIGSGIQFREAPDVLKRGTVLLIAKFLGGFIPGLLVDRFFGPAGILGLTPLVLIAAWSNSNGGLYMGLTAEFGDEVDVSSQGLLCLNDGPFLTMIGMGVAGLANIPIKNLIGTVLPLALGCILGNLDPDMRAFLKPGGSLLIPFFAFPLGAGLNLRSVVSSGVPGILLGIGSVVVTGFFLILADKFVLKRPGYAGAALASVAGNAAATPALLAQTDPRFAADVPTATAIITTAVVVTAILVPVFTTWAVKMWGTGRPEAAKQRAATAR